MLKNDYIIVALYVDDKTKLPQKRYMCQSMTKEEKHAWKEEYRLPDQAIRVERSTELYLVR